MSIKHPIIAITGSSGAGTTSVTRTFETVFRREIVKAAVVEGDSFHRFDRAAMKVAMAEAEAAGNQHFSHFGEEANLFAELEALFRDYGESGTGMSRKYLHNAEEAAPFKPAHYQRATPLAKGETRERNADLDPQIVWIANLRQNCVDIRDHLPVHVKKIFAGIVLQVRIATCIQYGPQRFPAKFVDLLLNI